MTTAIRITSLSPSAAACPNMNLSSPLLLRSGQIVDHGQEADARAAKKAASTKPSAASSLCRVVVRTAVNRGRAQQTGRRRADEDGDRVLRRGQRNPSARPGSTACDNASPINASLRTDEKTSQQSAALAHQHRSDGSALRSEGSRAA